MKRSLRAVSVVLLVAGVSGIANAETKEDAYSSKFGGLSFSVPQGQSFAREHSNVARSGSSDGGSSVGDLLPTIGLIAILAGALLMFSVKLFPKKAMTISGVGKIVPSQLFLMQLAGLVIGWRGRAENPTEEQIATGKREGYKRLKGLTREDFGWDVERWFEFLATHADKYRFTYPQGYANMRSFLEECGHNLPWNEDIEMTS